MKFTDIFITRPVLAIVISLLIFFLGLRAISDMPLRQFPKIDNTVIQVTTSYPGASADLIQGFITTPIEKAIASADGIDYLTATSDQSLSTVSAHIQLGYSPQKSFTDVMSKVNQIRSDLPKESEDLVINQQTGQQIALMYISFSSSDMSPEQITNYISRVISPEIERVTGVSKAEILGGSKFAMRIWLDSQKMAALGVTSTDVTNALLEKNFLSAAGKTKGEFVAYNVAASTDIHTAEEFKQIVIRSDGDAMLRLQDVAKVELGASSYDSSVTFDGKQGVFVAVNTTPTANPLTVIDNVRQLLPKLQHDYPQGLDGKVVYDATNYIRSSINEVIRTIIEATVIVIIVIFLFLGSIRSVMIPVVTIPLSLIGVCSLMLVLGFSINLLTLLAMVLAIGLVVDDAIVVVENIHRHIEKGLSPMDAAIKGAREIAMPVITMTLTLAAVYAPIAFMGGITGALFNQFAFTLASAVIISGFIALTLSPMLCSRLLDANPSGHRFEHWLDMAFSRIRNTYTHILDVVLNHRKMITTFAILVLLSCFYLYAHSQEELAPTEDQSALFVSATAPQYANIDYVTQFTKQFDGIFQSFPEMQDYFIINGMGAVNNVIAGMILKPWNERTVSQQALQPLVQEKLAKIAGLSTVIFPLPSLPAGGDGLPVQFVVTTTSSPELLFQVSEGLLDVANKSGLFIFLDSSLKFNKPHIKISIDRNKAASLGVSIQDIGNTLATALGGGKINLFSMEGRSYDVIPQLLRQYRMNPEQLKQLYVRTASGKLVALSTIISMKQTTEPNSLEQFQQLNSATIQGMPMPGVSQGEILSFLQKNADAMFPQGFRYDYAGQLRQYVQEGSQFTFLLLSAFIIIFLVLAAQFESFRDPWIILSSVPISAFGALLLLNFGIGGATINIYTKVGLVTLIGLISKHGIMMVDFANRLQVSEKLPVREAIEKAAAIRLRPILMTTAAMVLGVMPLVFASGAGAASRYNLGLVIASGMTIGTLFTLFVVPTMYTFFSKARN